MTRNLLLIINIVTITYLTSRTTRLPTEQIIDSPYTVVQIDNWFDNKTTCSYHLTTHSSYAYYDNEIEMVDSIGKFTIRDTVYIHLYKR